MSNGLQQVAGAASFFPTAKELSGGIQWFKDHPVLAAAAATAVSVLTYYSALETSATGGREESVAVVSSDKDLAARGGRSEAPAQRTARERTGSTGRSSAGSSGRRSSEGKMTAAVSWCDEHGGSLTQVFEEMHVREERNSGGSVRVVSAAGEETRFLARVPQEAEDYDYMAQALDARSSSDSLTTLSSDAGNYASRRPDENAMDLDAQTESPQWGWYVAITPPQDPLCANVPRAMSQPPRANGLHRNGSSGTGSLRRSISGRIP